MTLPIEKKSRTLDLRLKSTLNNYGTINIIANSILKCVGIVNNINTSNTVKAYLNIFGKYFNNILNSDSATLVNSGDCIVKVGGQIINSALTNILIIIGIATLCSWWFCLTRSSKIIISISLSAVFMILFLFIYYLFSFENLQPPGLHSPTAILLNSGLQSLTILLSFVFVLIIGILITREPYREEE